MRTTTWFGSNKSLPPFVASILRTSWMVLVRLHASPNPSSQKRQICYHLFLDIKKIVDTLAAVGSPTIPDDHIAAILDGLSEDYDGFVKSVTSKIYPYSVQDIEALLLAQEERFDRHSLQEQQIVQANVAFTSNNTSRNFSRSPSSQNRGGRFRFNNRNSRSSFRNNTRNSTTNNTNHMNRVQCQICGKNGHSALNCWHQYEQDNSTSITANSSQLFPSCDNDSSILGTPSTLNDPLWYPGSGAHITLPWCM